MPFFISDPEWQGRSRDGIPGQSLIHRPVMEGSDSSSSDDEDDEIEENPGLNRLSKMSHTNPHTAVEEYHQCQIEEIIMAIKDFDTYAARYPPEAIPKARSYYADRGIPGELDTYPRIDRDTWTVRDSSSTAASIESQATSKGQCEAVDLQNHTDRQLRTLHVLCGRDLTQSISNTEENTSVTPRSERYLSTNSSISDFVPEWPATTQGFSTLPSYHRQAVAAVKGRSLEEPKPKPGLISAARKFVTQIWTKKSPQPDTETFALNHVAGAPDSASPRAATTSNVYADSNFLDINLH